MLNLGVDLDLSDTNPMSSIRFDRYGSSSDSPSQRAKEKKATPVRSLPVISETSSVEYGRSKTGHLSDASSSQSAKKVTDRKASTDDSQSVYYKGIKIPKEFHSDKEAMARLGLDSSESDHHPRGPNLADLSIMYSSDNRPKKRDNNKYKKILSVPADDIEPRIIGSLEEFGRRLNEADRENKKLRDQVKQFQDGYKEAMTQLQKLKEKRSDLKITARSLADENHNYKTELHDLKELLANTTKDLSRVIAEKSELERVARDESVSKNTLLEMTACVQELEPFKEKAERLQTENDNLKRRMAELEAENARLRERSMDVDTLRVQNTSLETSVDDLRRQNDYYSHKLADCTKELEALKVERDDLLRKLSEERDVASKKTKVLSDELDASKKEVESLKKILSSVEAKLELKEQEIISLLNGVTNAAPATDAEEQAKLWRFFEAYQRETTEHRQPGQPVSSFTSAKVSPRDTNHLSQPRPSSVDRLPGSHSNVPTVTPIRSRSTDSPPVTFSVLGDLLNSASTACKAMGGGSVPVTTESTVRPSGKTGVTGQTESIDSVRSVPSETSAGEFSPIDIDQLQELLKATRKESSQPVLSDADVDFLVDYLTARKKSIKKSNSSKSNGSVKSTVGLKAPSTGAAEIDFCRSPGSKNQEDTLKLGVQAVNDLIRHLKTESLDLWHEYHRLNASDKDKRAQIIEKAIKRTEELDAQQNVLYSIENGAENRDAHWIP
jgi:uncharacterized coiled-coil DUF342 family protein